MQPTQPLKLVLLMPVYDDWQCARLLIEKLDTVLAGVPASARIILVDDASLAPPPTPFLDS
jgi:hypothetical protein